MFGKISHYSELKKQPELRKQNRINSIHSSLAIENNSLSSKQVKDIINGKMVVGNKKDIQEVKNAIEAYDKMTTINPYSMKDLLKIHGIMTFLTIEDSGKFRNHPEGVKDGDVVIFVAPSEKLVPKLMKDLFDWLNKEKDTMHPLILSSIFHYELVFIHPFSDGNGRMARLWQSTILSKWKDIFAYLPIESLIKKYQSKYYKAISNSNIAGSSNAFIEFMLEIIYKTLLALKKEVSVGVNVGVNVGVKLSPTQIKIVELISNNSKITAFELAKRLKVTPRTVERNLATLKEKKVITRIGSDKTGSWKINR